MLTSVSPPNSSKIHPHFWKPPSSCPLFFNKWPNWVQSGLPIYSWVWCNLLDHAWPARSLTLQNLFLLPEAISCPHSSSDPVTESSGSQVWNSSFCPARRTQHQLLCIHICCRLAQLSDPMRGKSFFVWWMVVHSETHNRSSSENVPLQVRWLTSWSYAGVMQTTTAAGSSWVLWSYHT